MRWLLVLLVLAVPAQAWETLPTPLPYVVDDAAAAYDGHGIHIIGGTVDGQATDQVLRLTLEDGIARPYAVLPEPRSGAAAVFGDRSIHIYGGNTSGSILLYDTLERQVFRTAATLPDNRTGVAAAWVGDEAYIVGGDPCNPCSILRHFPPYGAFPSNTTLPWPIAGAGVFWDGHQLTILGGHRLDIDAPHQRIAIYDPVHEHVERLELLLPGTGSVQAVYDGRYAYVLSEGWDNVLRYDPTTRSLADLEPAIPRDVEGASLVLASGALYIVGADGDRVLRLDPADAWVDHGNPWCARLDVAPCPPIRSTIPLFEIVLGALLPFVLAAMWFRKPALHVPPRTVWVVAASAMLVVLSIPLPWAQVALGDATGTSGLLRGAGAWWDTPWPYLGAALLLAAAGLHWPMRTLAGLRQTAAIAAGGIGVAWGVAAFALAWTMQGTHWTWTWGALTPLLAVVVLLSGLQAMHGRPAPATARHEA